MFRLLGVIAFAAGIVLIVLGVQAWNSTASDVSRFFTGEPTNRAVWYLLGGIALVLTGGGVAWRTLRGRRP